MVHQGNRALVPTATGEKKEYMPSAQLAKRLSSAWPRPAWHAPWRMYRVVAGHLGCASFFVLSCMPERRYWKALSVSQPERRLSEELHLTLIICGTDAESLMMASHSACGMAVQVGAELGSGPRERVLCNRLSRQDYQDLGPGQRAAEAHPDWAHRAGAASCAQMHL